METCPKEYAHTDIHAILDCLFLVLGPRLTLFFGSLGYAVYVGALWW